MLREAGQVLQEGESLVLCSGQLLLRAATRVLRAGRVLLRSGRLIRHAFERSRAGSRRQAVRRSAGPKSGKGINAEYVIALGWPVRPGRAAGSRSDKKQFHSHTSQWNLSLY
jgi:hypothetical protein